MFSVLCEGVMPIIGFLGVIVEILSYLDMISALICASVSVSADVLLFFIIWHIKKRCHKAFAS